jgi:hypothetical protein
LRGSVIKVFDRSRFSQIRPFAQPSTGRRRADPDSV